MNRFIGSSPYPFLWSSVRASRARHTARYLVAYLRPGEVQEHVLEAGLERVRALHNPTLTLQGFDDLSDGALARRGDAQPARLGFGDRLDAVEPRAGSGGAVGHPLELEYHAFVAGKDLLEVGVRVQGDDVPTVDDAYTVAERFGLGHLVGREHHGDAGFGQLLDELSYRAGGLRVQPEGRLVQEHHARLRQEGARDVYALLHARRESTAELVPPLPHAELLEPLLTAGTDVLLAHVVYASEEPQVFHRREAVIQDELLGDEADVPPGLGGLAHDVVTGDLGRTRRRARQRAEHPDGGRLAGAVRPEEPEDLTLWDVEADLVDGFELAEVLAQALYLYVELLLIHAPCLSSVVTSAY